MAICWTILLLSFSSFFLLFSFAICFSFQSPNECVLAKKWNAFLKSARLEFHTNALSKLNEIFRTSFQSMNNNWIFSLCLLCLLYLSRNIHHFHRNTIDSYLEQLIESKQWNSIIKWILVESSNRLLQTFQLVFLFHPHFNRDRHTQSTFCSCAHFIQ